MRREVRRFDRVLIGDGRGSQFELFDPPWWRLDRWLWWLWAVRRAGEHGTVTIGVDGGMRTVRCRRVR